MRRFFIVVSLILVLTGCFIVGCGKPAELSQKQLLIASGSKSGVYYPVGEVIARTIKQKFSDVQVQVIETEGSLANLTMLQEGKANLALVQNDIAHYAVHGQYMFDGKKLAGLRGLATLFPEVVHIITKKEAGINELAGLAGKKVAVGTENSGTYYNAQQILEKAKVWDQIEKQNLSFGDSIVEFEKGNIDAFLFSSGVPNPKITELAGKVEISIIPVSPDLVMEMVNASPSFYFPSTVQEGSYPGIASSVSALEINALLISNSSLNENDTYMVTKNLFGSLPSLRESHKALANITENSLRRQMTINLCPGAKKALSHD